MGMYKATFWTGLVVRVEADSLHGAFYALGYEDYGDAFLWVQDGTAQVTNQDGDLCVTIESA